MSRPRTSRSLSVRTLKEFLDKAVKEPTERPEFQRVVRSLYRKVRVFPSVLGITVAYNPEKQAVGSLVDPSKPYGILEIFVVMKKEALRGDDGWNISGILSSVWRRSRLEERLTMVPCDERVFTGMEAASYSTEVVIEGLMRLGRVICETEHVLPLAMI